MLGPRLLQLKRLGQKARGVWLEGEAYINCCQASVGCKISKRGCINGTTCACYLLSQANLCRTLSSFQFTSFLFHICYSLILVVSRDF